MFFVCRVQKCKIIACHCLLQEYYHYVSCFLYLWIILDSNYYAKLYKYVVSPGVFYHCGIKYQPYAKVF